IKEIKANIKIAEADYQTEIDEMGIVRTHIQSLKGQIASQSDIQTELRLLANEIKVLDGKIKTLEYAQKDIDSGTTELKRLKKTLKIKSEEKHDIDIQPLNNEVGVLMKKQKR